MFNLCFRFSDASYDKHSMSSPTIRHSQCTLLVDVSSPRCLRCTKYCQTLQAMKHSSKHSASSSEKTSSVSSHVNNCFMSTPDKI